MHPPPLRHESSASGVAECPCEFYRNWVTNSGTTQQAVEKITRTSVGTAECPIAAIPAAS